MRYIGKEADRLEERFYQAAEGNADIVYDLGSSLRRSSTDALRLIAKGIKITEISRQTGFSAKHVSNILRGIKSGSASAHARINSAIVRIALDQVSDN